MGRAHPIELTNMCMLRRSDGMVLVQNRRDPNWGGLTFPGGHVEPGESLVDSVNICTKDDRLSGVELRVALAM